MSNPNESNMHSGSNQQVEIAPVEPSVPTNSNEAPVSQSAPIALSEAPPPVRPGRLCRPIPIFLHNDTTITPSILHFHPEMQRLEREKFVGGKKEEYVHGRLLINGLVKEVPNPLLNVYSGHDPEDHNLRRGVARSLAQQLHDPNNSAVDYIRAVRHIIEVLPAEEARFHIRGY